MGIIEKEDLGYRQQLIMQCVWEAEESVTVPEIIDRLEEKCGKRFSASAINTMVLSLIDKGFLQQGPKIHQAFTYSAVISKEEFQLREAKRFRKLTYDNSPSVMLAALLKTDISEEELEIMREMLRE